MARDATLNCSRPTADQCGDPVQKTAAFAGFSDWRLPNRFELETLLNLESIDPAVSDVFNSDCGANSGGNPGCTVTTCSCTVVGYYWTSSTCAGQTQSAWVVDFGGGGVYDGIGKVLGNSVRAVRSGS